MKKIILVILSVFFALTLVLISCLRDSLAQEAANLNPNSLFYQANSDYKEGKYDLAIGNYEQLVNLGLASGNLYYNLANSYFKKGALGLAVLNYERAKQYIPQDSDLRSNYDYVLSVLNLTAPSLGNGFPKMVNRLLDEMTVNFLTIVLFSGYFILIMVLMAKVIFFGQRKFFKGLIIVLSGVCILFAAGLSSKIIHLSKSAIVISQEVEVKFEPLLNATTYFKLSEGNKIEVTERIKDWYKIKRFDGKLGWVDKDSVKMIEIK